MAEPAPATQIIASPDTWTWFEKSRWYLATAAVGYAWYGIGAGVTAVDGSHGLTLMNFLANPGTWLTLAIGFGATIAIMLLLLPTFGMVWTLAAGTGSIVGYAWGCGSLDDWVRRGSPGGYGMLIVELVVWAGILAGFMVLMPWLKQKWAPADQAEPALPDDAAEPDASQTLPTVVDFRPLLTKPDQNAWAAGLITVVVGLFASLLAVRTPVALQAVGGIALAMGIAGFVARMALPHARPTAVLFAPLAVALVGYAYTMAAFGSPADFLPAWFDPMQPPLSRVPGPALATPAVYASAGVLGVIIGWYGGYDENKDAKKQLEAA